MQTQRFNKAPIILFCLSVIVTGIMGFASYFIRNQGNIDQERIIAQERVNEYKSFDYQSLNGLFSQTMTGYYELKKMQDPKIEPYDVFIDDKENVQNEQELRNSLSQYYSTTLFNANISGSYAQYLIYDNTTEKSIANDPTQNLMRLLQNPGELPNLPWYIMFSFDSEGTMSVTSYQFLSDYYVNDNANNLVSGGANGTDMNTSGIVELYNNMLSESRGYSIRSSLGETSKNLVKDATFIFAFDQGAIDTQINSSNYSYDTYTDYASTFFNIMLVSLCLAITLFKIEAKELPFYTFIRKVPYEVHLLITVVIMTYFYGIYGIFYELAVDLLSISTLSSLMTLGMFILYFSYIFLLMKESYKEKIWEPYFFAHKLFSYIIHLNLSKKASLDLSKKDNLRALMLAIINLFLILFFIVIGGYGVVLAILYCILVFFVAIHYLTKTRNDYHTLLDITKDLSTGNFKNDIMEDFGMFNDFKNDIIEIRENFKHAVEEEVHSQKMKTELISNVSHDLKTPLTSIITYTDLLKKDDLSEKERKKYITTLDRNAIRLKHLIEDLFEVSKANSGNIKLEKMEIDICSLMKQVQVELADKLDKAKLDIRNNFSDEKILCVMDPQKTYRIFENLLTNIAKYAMISTRVYIHIEEEEKHIEISLRNISATELNFKAEDITERFMRGDKSRNTEGSGLGLAIAKTFSELHGGKLDIHIDGDLFKVILRFPKNITVSQTTPPQEENS